MAEFIPQQKAAQDVPWFEDAASTDGWQGQTTQKSEDRLKAEVMAAITRLGGSVTSFQRGTFTVSTSQRDGFRLSYFVEGPNGQVFQGQMDAAALPVKRDPRRRRSMETRRAQSLRMALYMLRDALDGLWFLQQLSPGYAPLMPWMIEARSGKTISQLWLDAGAGLALPPGEFDMEGEAEELGDGA